MTSYHSEYEGYYRMRFHDDEQNALKRWFENFKVDQYAVFASDYEWLVVHEVPATAKTRKKKYRCEIGDDGRNSKRFAEMDHTAPKPPMVFLANKRVYQPPPPKTAEELRREYEYERMYRMGYRPIRRPVYTADVIPWNTNFDAVRPIETKFDIDWVKQVEPSKAFQSAPVTPRPPSQLMKHRRNV